MGVKGEVNFVKVAGARLLQGPVMVRSRLWDGEIEIATIPDYCAYLRVMSWVDVFDVKDTAVVRAPKFDTLFLTSPLLSGFYV